MLLARLPGRVLISGFPVIKGAAIGVTTTAVLHARGLSTFAQALIIALVSAFIGALGVICAALISAQAAERVLAEQYRQNEDLHAIKGAIGADKRDTDTGKTP